MNVIMDETSLLILGRRITALNAAWQHDNVERGESKPLPEWFARTVLSRALGEVLAQAEFMGIIPRVEQAALSSPSAEDLDAVAKEADAKEATSVGPNQGVSPESGAEELKAALPLKASAPHNG